jgi:hypothetical protein
MAYTQIRLNDLALARGRTIDPDGQVGGYPAYRAEWTNNTTSVLTILYRDDSGIYLTSKKDFKWVIIGDGSWFSANLSLPSYVPGGLTYIPWNDAWANQSNTTPDYNGLVLQAATPGEALRLISSSNIPLSFYRDIPNNQGRNVPWENEGAWIGGVNDAGKLNGAPVAYSWWPGNALHFASFYLRERGNEWSLRPTNVGLANYNESNVAEGSTEQYVGHWEAFGGLRWKITNRLDNVLTFNIDHIGGYTYQLATSDGKRLNQGGHWLQLAPLISIWNGVEFYNGNNNGLFNIDFMIVEDVGLRFSITDEMVYRLGPWVVPQRSQGVSWGAYDPLKVRPNLPIGGNLCSASAWDGSQLDCYQQNIPYTYTLGNAECTTLDTFSNDVHCQEWGKAHKGEMLESRLRPLCAGSTYQANSICNCFLPDSVYYDRIASEVGVNAANGVRATKGLQCESGLCPQDGSLSAQYYYYGNRACSYCVQVFDLSLTAQQINLNLNLVQQCATTDASYTWPELIARLIDLGAYVQGVGGQYKDLVISQDKSTIYLNTTTAKGKYALQQLPLLQYLPNKDQYSRIVIDEKTWRGNITGISKDSTLYLLYIRAP